jgi:hypothetical protein
MNKALSFQPQIRGITFKHDPGEWSVTKRLEYQPEEKAKIAAIPLVYDLVCERPGEFNHAEQLLPLETIILINATLREPQAKKNGMESMAANAAIRAYCKIKTIPIHDVVRRIDIIA